MSKIIRSLPGQVDITVEHLAGVNPPGVAAKEHHQRHEVLRLTYPALLVRLGDIRFRTLRPPQRRISNPRTDRVCRDTEMRHLNGERPCEVDDRGFRRA